MVRMPRILTRLIPVLLLGLALGLPLQAQLDPRLQGSSTDFLDLYQQGNINVKPEIVSVFDFSGSMQSLMYHPCYYNKYLDDNGVTDGITFQLTGTPGSFNVTVTVGPTSWGFTAVGSASTPSLIRPDGSAVTEANIDANMTSQSPHLWGDKNDTGGGSWACDVRNWVRSASHVRLSKGGRTIDLPIPWKVMDINSTGYPLSSMTVLDQYKGLNDQGVPTTYGSGQNIEIDTRYKVQTFPSGTDQQTIDNNRVLSGAQNQVVTRTKYMLRLNPFYLNWIFDGKYQNTDSSLPDYDATYAGNYIVFDAASTTPNGIPVGKKKEGTIPNLATDLALQSSVQQGQGFGTFTPGADAMKALALPARDRVQAVKEAVIRTWIEYQTRVFWAYRFLDDVGEAGNDGRNNATATTINYDSTSTKNGTDATTTWVNGTDTGWTLFNKNSVAAMTRLAALFPYTNTPLTYATARALAQFTDPNNVFGTVETGTDAPVACQKHFLILFTDGVPTVDNNSENLASSPYVYTADLTGSTGDAETGNAALMLSPMTINPGNNWWNVFTFAGIAAHLADTTKTTAATPITSFMAVPSSYPSGSASPSGFLPFALKKRLTQAISAPYNLVTTMTVGVSLGGKLSDLKSPKRRLFLAAAVGDPSRIKWDLNALTSYTLKDPDVPSSGKTDNSTYFFDATNPDLLTKSLGYALHESTGGGQIGTTSNTDLPFIGAAIGKQIYIGKFKPPLGGDVMWSGDLLMFPTKIGSNNKTVILDKTGTPIGASNTKIDNTTAVWSAADSLPLWSNRKLKTRTPGATTLTDFTYTGAAYSNAKTANPPGLKNFVATDSTTYVTIGSGPTYAVSQTATQTAAQQKLIRMVMGADVSNTSKNRINIMGDIIDSSPSYLEYNTTGGLPGGLSVPSGSHFRLILVGTNQGWLHAFGETSSTSSVDDPTSTTTPKAKIDLVSASVQELWAFMPTDFLPYLDYLNTSTNSHKFMVDGSPSIYFLDLPPSSGGIGNGRLDGANDTIDPINDTTHERAIAIIGMRKGGRSYYALNLHDPTAPTLQWSLVPDEASLIPSSRNKTGLTDAALQSIVGNMGYSTCAPSFGRILFNGAYKDAVFLGGGLSLPEIEAKFTGAPLMGRSVLALDVYTGDFLAAVDLTTSSIGGSTSGGEKTMVGPVPAGVIPFEFILGSGMAQRAYFTDMWGGLWCWGSKSTIPASPTSTYSNFRMDTSDLQAWSSDGTKTPPYGTTGIRKVYQDANSVVTASSGTPTTYSFAGPTYTTLPAPFLLGSFPGVGYTYSDGTASAPVAVGVAMESGNRNNPLDYGSNNPANTRLTVVFDRQDSRAWGLDTATGPDDGIKKNAQLLDAGKWGANGAISSTLAYGNASVSKGSNTYYLAPNSASNTKFGYFLTFPDATTDSTGTHYSKGINPPSVVANSLYYSYFTPTAVDVCSGGSGFTYSNRICDVINPVVSDVRTGVTCASGLADTWVNIASDFTVLGAPGVQQAGTRATTSNGVTTTYTDTNTYLGATKTFYPRARVWRTVR